MDITPAQRGGIVVGLNALVFGVVGTSVVVLVLALLALAYSPHSTLIKSQNEYCKTQAAQGITPQPGSLCAR